MDLKMHPLNRVTLIFYFCLSINSPLQEFKLFPVSEAGGQSMLPSMIITTPWCQQGNITSSAPVQPLKMSLSLT